jgi:hypothetical protein
MMHIEKNVCAALFRTFTNCKGSKADSVSVQKAFEEMNMRPDLHAKEDGFDAKGNVKWKYKAAPWRWTVEEYDSIIEIIKKIRTPTGYGSSFLYKFSEKRQIVGMKTHDYHNLLHDILPIAIRGTLDKDIRSIVYRLGELFRWLCAKEINKSEIPTKREEATELLCDMEYHLPPSIWDIQFHLIQHLVDEVQLCGPVSSRWMYFVERYMKELKSFVRNRARPEASIAEGYLCLEGMSYINEYMLRLYKNAPKLWKSQENVRDSGVVLPKAKTIENLNPVLREQIHRFYLNNAPQLQKWRDRYVSSFSFFTC